MAAKKAAPKTSQLTPWESATDVGAEAQPGLVPARAATALTLFAFLVFSATLWPVMGFTGLLAAALFARLLALDLTTYTLPNIYTIPMLAVGLTHAFNHGLVTQSFLVAIILLVFANLLHKLKLPAGLGGGDLKLLAALFAFHPAAAALFAVGLGSLAWLPFAFVFPRRPVPFGVPVVLGWVILLRFPNLPNALFSTIS